MLYPLLKEKKISPPCKKIIFVTILRPILTYVNESWTLKKKLKSRIQAAEMKVLRIIKGVTRLDRLRNERIRQEAAVMSVLHLLEE